MAYRREVRHVEGLKSARFIPTPSWTVGGRSRGSAARGKAYERRVGEELVRRTDVGGVISGTLYLGPWIGYEDANGPGIAQPDALIELPDRILLIEVKLSQNRVALEQIEHLYGPLVTHIFKRPYVGLEVFKYPKRRRDATWVSGPDVLANTSKFCIYSWHHFGH